MPANMVKTGRDEKLWDRAKIRAEAEGHGGEWPYVVGVYQRMRRGVAKGAHLPGMLLLPGGYGRQVWGLCKGAGHRYIRRVPIPGKTTKTGKPRYRYYYDVAHGGGVANHEHMVEGASFKHGEGHFHIEKVDGDTLHIKHDESGETHTLSRHELAQKLEGEHGKALKAARERAAARVKEAEGSGANARQVAKLKDHAKRIGADGAGEGDRGKVVAESKPREQIKRWHSLSNEVKDTESKLGDIRSRANHVSDNAKVNRDAVSWADDAHDAGLRGLPMPMADRAKAGSVVFGDTRRAIARSSYPSLRTAPPDSKKTAMVAAKDAYDAGKTIACLKRELGTLGQYKAETTITREKHLNDIAPGLADEVRRNFGDTAAKDYLGGKVDSLTAGDLVDSVHVKHRMDARSHAKIASTLRAIEKRHGVGGKEAEHHEARVKEENEGEQTRAKYAEQAKAEREASQAKAKADEELESKASEGRAALQYLAEHPASETAKAAFEAAKAKVKTTAPGAFKPAPVRHDRDAAMARAKVFASTDETRPPLMTTHSTGTGQIVATDGHRLAIIPTSHTKRELVDTRTGREAHETFPNYEKVIPASTKNVATMDAAALRSALEAHVAHAKASVKGADSHTYMGGSDLVSRPQVSFEHGEGKRDKKRITHSRPDAKISAPVDGEFAGVHANTKYLLDALKGAKGTVRIGTTDQYSPIVIDREDGEKHIVMPLRRDAPPITKGTSMFGPLSLAFASLSKGPEAHTPPASVRAAAKHGLALREKHGTGGLTTQEAGAQGIGSGVARARDLAAGSAVSTKTLKRMVSFFARHRANKAGGEDDAGHIAWLLWGGDPGEAWAKRELAALEKGSAGNAPTYEAPPGAMRRVVVSGITCHVERMPGEVRHGRIVQNGYGDIPGTLDCDGEPMDCYIGPNALAGLVYVIDQLDADGDLDEHKAMIGFDSAEDAALAYVSCLPRSRMGGMCSVLAGDFIMWLTRNPELDDQPFAAIAEEGNLRVGRFGGEYQPDAGMALIPASQQNPG